MRSIKLNVATGIRIKLLVPALLAAAFALPVMASDQYSDTARVISVTPQTERVNMPRQVCRTEYQQQSYSNGGDRSVAGAVIGGIAGGLLGNTIGRGNGRIAAAAVGAGVGALAGDRIGNSRNSTVSTRSVPIESCYQVDNWQTVNSGYLVTYEYNGRTYSTVTESHPGNTMDVDVTVSSARHASSNVRYISPVRYSEPRWDNERHDYGKYKGWSNRHGNDNDGDRRYY